MAVQPATAKPNRSASAHAADRTMRRDMEIHHPQCVRFDASSFPCVDAQQAQVFILA